MVYSQHFNQTSYNVCYFLSSNFLLGRQIWLYTLTSIIFSRFSVRVRHVTHLYFCLEIYCLLETTSKLRHHDFREFWTTFISMGESSSMSSWTIPYVSFPIVLTTTMIDNVILIWSLSQKIKSHIVQIMITSLALWVILDKLLRMNNFMTNYQILLFYFISFNLFFVW